jgi:phosphoserine phosphatase
VIKAVLLDFDGTLVTRDIAVLLAEHNGKGEESRQLLADFHHGKSKGLGGLVERVNMLKGVTLKQIDALLDQDNFLMPGALELLDYLHRKHILTVLASGNVLPVLRYYQHKVFHVDHVIGSNVHVEQGVITGIYRADYSDPDYKLYESRKILDAQHITAQEAVAIGDSPGDLSKFEFAGHAIAINPVGGVESAADYVIHDDVSKAIKIIEELNRRGV